VNWSIVLRIRLRSRILRKHDLEIEEIFCANDRFLSKMTPRLRAESTGESMTMTLSGRWMVGLLSLESCCGLSRRRRHQTTQLSRFMRFLKDDHYFPPTPSRQAAISVMAFSSLDPSAAGLSRRWKPHNLVLVTEQVSK